MRSLLALSAVFALASSAAFADGVKISNTKSAADNYSGYKCKEGFTLKTNASGLPWPEVSMGKIDSKAKVPAGVDTLTCQYNKYYNKSCDSGYVLMPNAVAKDTCNRKGTIDLTPKDATCPAASKFGADVREVIEAGKDQCFYYEKPTTPS